VVTQFYGQFSPFRVIQGQSLTLHTISNAVVTVRAWARVLYDDGTSQLLTVPEVPRLGTRVAEALAAGGQIVQDGWIVNAEVEMVTPDIKRGQTYVRLSIETFGCVLCCDYCFSDFGNISLGTFVPPGPAGGSGHLRTITIKADGAPDVSTLFAMALSNTIRKYLQFIWYYHASSTVASRVLAADMRDILGAYPTGFLGAVVWAGTGAGLTLTADEDGTVFADTERGGTNDAGNLVIASAAVNPSPFPRWVSEDDNDNLFFLVASGEATDRDAIYGAFEEWVLP